MKTFLFLLVTLQVIGQNKGGVYLTFNDYLNNRLRYKINCKTDKETLKQNEFINEPYIKVVKGKQKIKLYKDSIYAFKPCNEPLIRFQDNKQYHFAERGPLWIYYVEKPETNKQEFKSENPYWYSVEKEYYFSLCGDGKIVPLTIENIRQAFPANHVLYSIVNAKFKTIPISAYDTAHKIFKINEVIYTVNGIYVCPKHPKVKGKQGDKCPTCGKELESMKQEKHTELDALNEADMLSH